MPSPPLQPAAADVAARLRDRGEHVAVAEVSAGGLISASLLAIPGASAYFAGGFVVYTVDGALTQLGDASPLERPERGATEPFARWLADAARRRMGTTWGVGETGAAGPGGNGYGDPSGHGWIAVAGPGGVVAAHVLTGDDDRAANMAAFAARALELLATSLDGAVRGDA